MSEFSRGLFLRVADLLVVLRFGFHGPIQQIIYFFSSAYRADDVFLFHAVVGVVFPYCDA